MPVQLVIHAQRSGARTAATASIPARTRASNGVRKSLALAGSCSPGQWRRASVFQRSSRDEQPPRGRKLKGVLNPDRAVAQRSAQGEQGGHLHAERPLTVDVSDGLTPCRAQARCRDLARQGSGAGSVQGAQPVQRIDRRMLAPWLARPARSLPPAASAPGQWRR